MKAYHDQGKQEMMMMMMMMMMMVMIMVMIMKYEGCRVNTHMKYTCDQSKHDELCCNPTIASHFNCYTTNVKNEF